VSENQAIEILDGCRAELDPRHELELVDRDRLPGSTLIEPDLSPLEGAGNSVQELDHMTCVHVRLVNCVGEKRAGKRPFLSVRALREECELLCALGVEGDIQSAAFSSHMLTVARDDTIRVHQHPGIVAPMARVIDLNADVGEGIEGDIELLAFVTSANVACGFHAGDAATMRAVCTEAAERGVAIGAHVGYRDLEGFGRRALDVPAATVQAETVEQIRALQEASGHVAYVKPHGALYHRASVDEECAAAIVSAAEGLAVLGAPGSALLAQASAAGLAAVPEGFVDRAYAPDGSLVPRGSPGAVLGVEDAVRQALAIARDRVDVRSLCLHGDTPGALELARRVVAGLEAAGVELRSFA
jgi:UPF0271 protein